jgi:hypothetical protein
MSPILLRWFEANWPMLALVMVGAAVLAALMISS